MSLGYSFEPPGGGGGGGRYSGFQVTGMMKGFWGQSRPQGFSLTLKQSEDS